MWDDPVSNMKKTTSHSAPVDGAGMNGSRSTMTVTKRIISAAIELA
jgi:hypothetical protein